ncbi:MAG: hypothetical protein V3575_04325 [Candidatus Absconditabacteria bacterium]
MQKNIEALKILFSLINEYNKNNSKKIIWALTGSLSLYLQGVDVNTSTDIDILTDKFGSETIDKLLSNYTIKKSQYSGTEKFRSYFGIYQILGIQVEIMGDLQYLSNKGTRTKDNLNKNIIEKKYLGMNIPLFDLKYEMKVYKEMGRLEKT